LEIMPVLQLELLRGGESVGGGDEVSVDGG